MTQGACTYPAGVASAVTYAQDVLAGVSAACRLVHRTCARFLSDLEAAEAGQGPWAFRPDLAERAMIFAGLMPNIKGPEAGRPLRLMPWQRLVFANLFGFVERDTTARRFRQAVIYVPRGNGKTSIAAPLALYLSFLDGEGGAEGYAAAVTRDQARILFDTAREMVRRSPEIRRRYGVEALANAVWQERTSSQLAADQLGRQGAGRAERAGRRLRRDRVPQDERGVRRAAHGDGQAAQPAAARHLDRDRQQHRRRQAALGLCGPGAGGHADG